MKVVKLRISGFKKGWIKGLCWCSGSWKLIYRGLRYSTEEPASTLEINRLSVTIRLTRNIFF